MSIPFRRLLSTLLPLFTLLVACEDNRKPAPENPPSPLAPRGNPTPQPGGYTNRTTQNLEGGGMSGSFNAAHNGINRGEGARITSTTLSWNIKNASSCALAGEAVPAQGQKTVSPESDASYELVCSSPQGELRSIVKVAVARIESFTSEKPALFLRESNTLTWAVHNVRLCEISGSPIWNASTHTHTGPGKFVLSCQGFDGEKILRTLEIPKKGDSSIVSFSLNESSFNLEDTSRDQTIDITALWEVKDAWWCRLSADGWSQDFDALKSPQGSTNLKIKLSSWRINHSSRIHVELNCSQDPYWSSNTVVSAKREVHFAWLTKATLTPDRPLLPGERARLVIEGNELSDCSLKAVDDSGNETLPPATVQHNDSHQVRSITFLAQRAGRHVLTCHGLEGHVFLREFHLQLAASTSRVAFSKLSFTGEGGEPRPGLAYEPGFDDGGLITWKTEGARKCRWSATTEGGKRLLGPYEQNAPTAGTFKVRAGDALLTASDTFTLTCEDQSGIEGNASITVKVEPLGIAADAVYLNDDQVASVSMSAPTAPQPCRWLTPSSPARNTSEMQITLPEGQDSLVLRASCPGFAQSRTVEKSLTLYRISKLHSVCSAGPLRGDVHIRDEHGFHLFKKCRLVEGNLIINPRSGSDGWARHLSFDLESARSVQMTGTNTVMSLALPNLKTLAGLGIRNNSAFEGLTIHPQATLGSVSIEENPLLTQLVLPESTRVSVMNNANLAQLHLPRSRTLAALEIRNNALREISMPNLQEISWKIEIVSEPRLASLELPALSMAREVAFRNLPLTILTLPKLDSAVNLEISNLPLAKLDLSATRKISSFVLSKSGSEGESFELLLPQCLGMARGRISLQNNAKSLGNIKIRVCETKDYDAIAELSVVENDGIESLSIESTENAKKSEIQRIQIDSNPALKETRLKGVETGPGYSREAPYSNCGTEGLTFRSNGHPRIATHLELDSMTRASLCIERNPGLRRVSFKSLAAQSPVVLTYGHIRHNPLLTALDGLSGLSGSGIYDSDFLAIHDNAAFRWTRASYSEAMALRFSKVLLDPHPTFADEL